MTIYASPWWLSSPAKELSATVSVMQGSSKELSSLVAARVWKNVNKGCCCLLKYKIPKNSLSQRSPLVAVWSEALVYRKVGRVSIPASSVLRVLATLKSSDRTKESVCGWLYIYTYIYIWPCARVHRSTSLMNPSLLLQQCPACLVRLTWIVFVINFQLQSMTYACIYWHMF